MTGNSSRSTKPRRCSTRGQTALADLNTERRVVVHASTSEGLKALAQRESADLIVFGSEYRTPAGRVSPQKSTQSLLEGGPAAIAIAPSSYQGDKIHTIGLLAGLDDHAAIDTAHHLATHFEAVVTDSTHGVGLLIVGSRPRLPMAARWSRRPPRMRSRAAWLPCWSSPAASR